MVNRLRYEIRLFIPNVHTRVEHYLPSDIGLAIKCCDDILLSFSRDESNFLYLMESFWASSSIEKCYKKPFEYHSYSTDGFLRFSVTLSAIALGQSSEHEASIYAALDELEVLYSEEYNYKQIEEK